MSRYISNVLFKHIPIDLNVFRPIVKMQMVLHSFSGLNYPYPVFNVSLNPSSYKTNNVT